ncbi:MAG: 30S ribosomal protein S5 [Candidatus Paceibacterota bacterium]|jgi:small subunit ribosomal protein S5
MMNAKRRERPIQPKSEYKERTIDLRRVARVMAGGKRFSFRCTLIIGDERGKVGVGIAKGKDVAQAMDKARNDAKKNLFRVPLKGTTIAREVGAKFSAARVIIKPAQKGSGLKAGGSVRTVLSMAGITDATAKSLGRTKNKLTNALAAAEALRQLSA